MLFSFENKRRIIMERIASLFDNFIVLNLFVITFSYNFLFSQTEEKGELNGFRNAVWGSSFKEVKAAETEEYLQSFHGFGVDALSYKGNIAGLLARIDYSFKDGKLFEGTYSINPEQYFKIDFGKLKNYLTDKYGKPDFRAGPLVNSDSVWIKITDYGKFKGPELYWKFTNGFVGLIASKFEIEITLTILYSNNKSIENFSKDELISTDNFVK
jgi:hypothetical protein